MVTIQLIINPSCLLGGIWMLISLFFGDQTLSVVIKLNICTAADQFTSFVIKLKQFLFLLMWLDTMRLYATRLPFNWQWSSSLRTKTLWFQREIITVIQWTGPVRELSCERGHVGHFYVVSRDHSQHILFVLISLLNSLKSFIWLYMLKLMIFFKAAWLLHFPACIASTGSP